MSNKKPNKRRGCMKIVLNHFSKCGSPVCCDLKSWHFYLNPSLTIAFRLRQWFSYVLFTFLSIFSLTYFLILPFILFFNLLYNLSLFFFSFFICLTCYFQLLLSFMFIYVFPFFYFYLQISILSFFLRSDVAIILLCVKLRNISLW